jgi:hypothetical protein
MNTARPRIRKVFEEKVNAFTEHTKSQAVRKAQKENDVENWVNRDIDAEVQAESQNIRRKVTAGDLKRKRYTNGIPTEVNQEIIRQAVVEARPQVAGIFNQQKTAKNKAHVSTINGAFEKDSL